MTNAVSARFVNHDNAEAIAYGGGRMAFLANATETSGAFGLVEERMLRGFSPPMHLHHREDESFYVIEGAVRFVLDGQEHMGESGSFVFLPRGLPHGFIVESAEACLLNLVSPGGFEHFFRQMADVEAAAVPGAGIDLAKAQELAAGSGFEILGPPLSLR
jgi:mannose-6-phosphate isomerase-like protein (cupin superfamily)